jgi:hypothetical protein
MICFSEQRTPDDRIYQIEIGDKTLHKLVCHSGHESYTLIQESKFEILFDFGVAALIDGYSDAAVTRFAVALERFYEFCIICWLFSDGLNEVEVRALLKKVSKKSERQLGIYFALYEKNKSKNKTDAIPEDIPEKWVKFRNDVIHSGYIPTKSESFEYAEVIYIFMRAMIQYIKRNNNESITPAINYNFLTQILNIGTAAQHQTISVPTIINIVRPSEKDLDSRIKELNGVLSFEGLKQA